MIIGINADNGNGRKFWAFYVGNAGNIMFVDARTDKSVSFIESDRKQYR